MVGGADPGAHLRRLREMEATLAPVEFFTQIESARSLGETEFVKVASRSLSVKDLRGFDRLEPYRAETLSPGATLYRGATGAAGRRLLVIFTGRGHGVMLPLPCFLQRLPSGEWDVLVLRDRKLTHFRAGCDGLGDSFPELAAAVMQISREYISLSALGLSMGGMAAIQLSLASGGIRAVAIGARRPMDVARLFADAIPPPAFDPVCACVSGKVRHELLFVFAADHAVDRIEAEAAAELVGGRLLGVPGTGRHAILADLWQKGDLAAFLRDILSNHQAGEESASVTVRPDRLIVRRHLLARIFKGVLRGARRGYRHVSLALGREA